MDNSSETKERTRSLEKSIIGGFALVLLAGSTIGLVIKSEHDRQQALRLTIIAGAARAKVVKVVGVDNVFHVISDGLRPDVKVQVGPGFDEKIGMTVFFDENGDDIRGNNEPSANPFFTLEPIPTGEEVVREVANPHSELYRSPVSKHLRAIERNLRLIFGQ